MHLRMYLWWSLYTLLLDEANSLLLYLCYVFQALINSLVCWSCTSALGLVLFHNWYYTLHLEMSAEQVYRMWRDFLFHLGQPSSTKWRLRCEEFMLVTSFCISWNQQVEPTSSERPPWLETTLLLRPPFLKPVPSCSSSSMIIVSDFNSMKTDTFSACWVILMFP